MRHLLLALFFIFGFQAHAICVSEAKANLRAGPGSKHPITWTVGRYTPLIDLERRGSWYKVKDQDGQIHWVYKGVVTKSFRCLSVKVAISALRTGPGKKHAVAKLPTVDRYTAFKYTDSTDNWFRVIDAWGKKFWIHRSNVWRPLKITNIGF